MASLQLHEVCALQEILGQNRSGCCDTTRGAVNLIIKCFYLFELVTITCLSQLCKYHDFSEVCKYSNLFANTITCLRQLCGNFAIARRLWPPRATDKATCFWLRKLVHNRLTPYFQRIRVEILAPARPRCLRTARGRRNRRRMCASWSSP